jgi:hypothetical protein
MDKPKFGVAYGWQENWNILLYRFSRMILVGFLPVEPALYTCNRMTV